MIEWTFIFLPIIFHAVVGVMITFAAVVSVLIATMLFGEGGLAALVAALGRRLAVAMRLIPKLPASRKAAQ